ncbi:MAG: heme exporter protein CcmB [Alphaproteobacteria bacterium]|nr:heme exporter protein CcmB [Alphaproteobacteria bacterium]
MRGFVAVLLRDLQLAVRAGGGAMLSLIFFASVVLLVPLGVGADHKLLAKAAPGLLWVAAALAVLLSLDRLFQADFEDGSLEQMTLGTAPLELIVLAKVLAGWLTTGLPLTVASPFFALQLHLEGEAALMLTLTLLIGTPGLSLVGAIAAALTLSVRRGGLLLSLLVLPLYVPFVIFGAGAVAAKVAGLSAVFALYMLGGLSALALVLALFAGAAALRLNLG